MAFSGLVFSAMVLRVDNLMWFSSLGLLASIVGSFSSCCWKAVGDVEK